MMFLYFGQVSLLLLLFLLIHPSRRRRDVKTKGRHASPTLLLLPSSMFFPPCRRPITEKKGCHGDGLFFFLSIFFFFSLLLFLSLLYDNLMCRINAVGHFMLSGRFTKRWDTKVTSPRRHGGLPRGVAQKVAGCDVMLESDATF